MKSVTPSMWVLRGRSRRRHASPSMPSSAAVRSMSRQAMAARPPSSGWANEISGRIHSIRSSSPNAWKNGEATAAGWTAEQTS